MRKISIFHEWKLTYLSVNQLSVSSRFINKFIKIELIICYNEVINFCDIILSPATFNQIDTLFCKRQYKVFAFRINATLGRVLPYSHQIRCYKACQANGIGTLEIIQLLSQQHNKKTIHQHRINSGGILFKRPAEPTACLIIYGNRPAEKGNFTL